MILGNPRPGPLQTEPYAQACEFLIFIFIAMLVSNGTLLVTEKDKSILTKGLPLSQPLSLLQLESHKRLQVHV